MQNFQNNTRVYKRKLSQTEVSFYPFIVVSDYSIILLYSQLRRFRFSMLDISVILIEGIQILFRIFLQITFTFSERNYEIRASIQTFISVRVPILKHRTLRRLSIFQRHIQRFQYQIDPVRVECHLLLRFCTTTPHYSLISVLYIVMSLLPFLLLVSMAFTPTYVDNNTFLPYFSPFHTCVIA